MKYFEDFEIGKLHEMGSYVISKAEIIEFAEQYDPQPYHLDPEAAQQSPFGGLIASGLQTMAITQRLSVEGLLSNAHGLGGPGFGETEFRKPVYPGDELTVTVEPLHKRTLESRPDAGMVVLEYITHNQSDEVVLSMTAKGLIERRDTP